jgi:hypothetical protein
VLPTALCDGRRAAFHVKQIGSVLRCAQGPCARPFRLLSPESAHDTRPVTDGSLERLPQELVMRPSVSPGRWPGSRRSFRILGTVDWQIDWNWSALSAVKVT